MEKEILDSMPQKHSKHIHQKTRYRTLIHSKQWGGK